MIKVGILFGGQSREREISFAGGRTVYDNLDKNIFEPVPVFIDSKGNFILLNWQFIYKGTIRDFYPPAKFYPETEKQFQIYIESLGELPNEKLDEIISNVGRRVFPNEFKKLFDIAFLTLHGPFGEDGDIQGLLDWYGVPYTGCGILPSAIGVNKIVQKKIMKMAQFQVLDFELINKNKWKNLSQNDKQVLLTELAVKLGDKLVIKSPNQGSSIGVSVVDSSDFQSFEKAVSNSFFMVNITKQKWQSLPPSDKQKYIAELTDIKTGIGLPVLAHAPKAKVPGGIEIQSPGKLVNFIEEQFHIGIEQIQLESIYGEYEIIVEKFVKGKEFSCIVIQDENGNPISLPPTQIIKSNEVFDYRAKYLPGITKKITPIDLPIPHIEMIREECARLFTVLGCNVYARIDGFFAEDGGIVLNDPNTTSGMLPSSFFFHQAAEIGLNPSQFITYIIRTSLVERSKEGKLMHQRIQLAHRITEKLDDLKLQDNKKIKVAVIMGGYSTERHISVESGRNIYEKLSSSVKYKPTPIFLSGNDTQFELYKMPINIMLKDNADDIKEKILNYSNTSHDVIQNIVSETVKIRNMFENNKIMSPVKISIEDLSKEFDEVFIALHGRPGEDGNLQSILDKYNIPYNGSGVQSSQTTINKFETNEILGSLGILVAKHRMVDKNEWTENPSRLTKNIEQTFEYPFIAKPHDDGCSSAVKKIKNTDELKAFCEMMFRDSMDFPEVPLKVLNLKSTEEFPIKRQFLIEDLIDRKDAIHFLEITGGMLTKLDSNGKVIYEVFEPSETLASGEVLSLEEKFLAGEGQNITPARFSSNPAEQKRICNSVKETLEKVARILNVEGYCRIDAFVRIYADGRVETIIIEINSLPGMTPATCIYHQAAIQGYKPYDFIDKILEFGKSRLSAVEK
ncbi:MAG: D-alanine--D-alanine ligase [Bacteroidota bacterium]|nr:D-alanine--D-alanine ligase [Bacteroidota bacterium]